MKQLQKPAYEVAPLLLGAVLERTINGRILKVKIVETEAYDDSDAASHSYKGITPRTDVMFGESGHLYVYFTYGMHYCCNIVTDKKGVGSAVLIRAAEPLSGEAEMEQRRGLSGIEISNGPAKVCQALGIDKQFNGHDLKSTPLKLIINTPLDPQFIVQSQRIGISKAIDTPWRFYIKDNKYVSKT